MSKDSFLQYLTSVRGDERAMGELRRALGNDPGLAVRHVEPHLPPDSPAAPRFYLHAGLYGAHRVLARMPGGDGRSIAYAYRSLVAKAPPGKEDAGGATGGKMYERHLTRLLDVCADDLVRDLRHALGLFERHREPIDWSILLTDLLGWDHDERYVQRRLAREMWG